MKSKQPILGNTGTLLFLVMISAFPPLSTDLYLPALPNMVAALQTTQSLVNFTLSSYFVVYAFGLLFWGPLSEKSGRKPILLIGASIYVSASFLCANSANIEQLIGFRILQAFGGSAVTVVAVAIIKDLYSGREREKIMATIMSLVVIAPMVAPVIGALLLKIATWEMIFVVLGVFGLLSIALSLCLTETLESRYEGSVVKSWGRLGVVLKNPRFILLLAVFSLVPMSMMAFLAAGPYIYVDHFGFSEQEFSYIFALNALFASFGPRAYIKITQYLPSERIISFCFMLLILCGLLTYSVGEISAWLFAPLIGLATLATITTRVPGTNLMLEQQDKDTGSAVAIIQFSSMICGSMGMMLVSVESTSLIESLGVIQLIIGVISGLLWLLWSRISSKNPQDATTPSVSS
ncbi:Bcr/CflA family drug resistance efflux transporter [Vibrio sp. MACH09]|uniref:multidrug effflux MFS transporter n=1 Tax=Vibrio sp. MACH09 TaxID=3025122 RepID=UPI0027914F53|nr:multidrug effflux MFS transporter [Vibrio sp. MACH09]GLO61950.1 Bcr/CflA family drug resistance efflux transporter [Vibrio sp. MACH09]